MRGGVWKAQPKHTGTRGFREEKRRMACQMGQPIQARVEARSPARLSRSRRLQRRCIPSCAILSLKLLQKGTKTRPSPQHDENPRTDL